MGLYHGLNAEERSRLDRLLLHAAESEKGVLKLEAKVTEQAFCLINHRLFQLVPGSGDVYQHKNCPSGERHENHLGSPLPQVSGALLGPRPK